MESGSLQVPGDGRELVVSLATAYKVRAEDGRRVEAVNISPFINNLPFGELLCFITDCPKGASTSFGHVFLLPRRHSMQMKDH